MTMRQPAAAADRMEPIHGHLLCGLKQDVTVRVYAPGGGTLELGGERFDFGSRSEALRILDDYLRRALERAATVRTT